MRTPPSSPWIIRHSVSVYRTLVRGLGPTSYFRPYGDLTIQLFRQCCQDAYRQRGIPGVLALWLPSFGDAIIQMVIEVLCVRQHISRPRVSVGTVVSALALEYCSAPLGIIRNFISNRAECYLRRCYIAENNNLHLHSTLEYKYRISFANASSEPTNSQ